MSRPTSLRALPGDADEGRISRTFSGVLMVAAIVQLAGGLGWMAVAAIWG